MKIELLQTEKRFRIKTEKKKKVYVFNVVVTDRADSDGITRFFDIKRTKYHCMDCKERLLGKELVAMKESIIKRMKG